MLNKAYRAYRREGLSHVFSNGINILRNNIVDIQYIDDYCYEESISRLKHHMEHKKVTKTFLIPHIIMKVLGNTKLFDRFMLFQMVVPY